MLKFIKELFDAVAAMIKFLDLSPNFNWTIMLSFVVLVIPGIGAILRLKKKRNFEIADEYFGDIILECPATSAHLRQANKALTDMFGRSRFVTLNQYRALARKNSNSVSVLVDDMKEMVGYFDVFPLTNSFGEKFLSEDVTECELFAENECDPQMANESSFIYIGAIFNLIEGNLSKRHVVSHNLFKYLVIHILTLYPPRIGRRYFALSSTKAGESLLRSFRFTHVKSQKDRSDKSDLFVLEYDEIPKVMQKIRLRFGNIESEIR